MDNSIGTKADNIGCNTTVSRFFHKLLFGVEFRVKLSGETDEL